MRDDTLGKLLEAEKEARSIMERARQEAKGILDLAEEGSKAEMKKVIENFHTERSLTLKESAMKAEKEAKKIKRDGVELANGLAGRSRTRIPEAVEEVMGLLFDGN